MHGTPILQVGNFADESIFKTNGRPSKETASQERYPQVLRFKNHKLFHKLWQLVLKDRSFDFKKSFKHRRRLHLQTFE